MNNYIDNLDKIFDILKDNYYKSDAPSVSLIAETTNNPFNILISTIISLRTKDQVTLQASKKLFKIVNSFSDLIRLSNNEIEKLIYPAGFYKIKTIRLKKIAEIIIDQYNGNIPDTIEELLKLPGVGRKTANLVVSLGFNKPGLCVDTHVHRITNRLGWVKTKKPEETEFKLREILPLNYWRSINEYLVSFGQTICKPVSPFCSICGLSVYCPKINVIKAR